MKRPLAIIGFTYLITLAVAVNFGVNLSVAAAVLSFFGAVFIVFSKSLRKFKAVICALVTASVAFSVFSAYYLYKIPPITELYDSEAYITGTVTELPYENYDRYYYLIKTDSVEIEGAEQNIKIRLSSKEALDLQMSDTVTVAVKFMKPDGSGYSSEEYNYSRGIMLYAYVLDGYPVTVVEPEKRPIYYHIVKTRVYLEELISQVYADENSGLLAGILLGDTSDISEETKNNFRKSGVYHLLAVSGMHTAFIGRWLMAIFEKLKMGKKLSAIIASVGVIFFMALTGFSASVTRAGIMTILYLLGNLFSRSSDSINSLGASCLIICLLNPYAACDLGLLMSVSATLGLIILSPKMSVWFKKRIDKLENKWLKEILNSISSVLCESLSATLFTLPITISFFKEFSLVSPITNVLMVMPSTVFMVTGTLSLLFFDRVIFKVLFYPLHFVTVILGDYLSAVVKFFADIPYSVVVMPFRFVSLWIALTLVLLGAAIILSKQKRIYKMWVFLSAVLFAFSAMSYQIFNTNVVKTCIIDVGDSCAVAVIKNKHGIIMECGGNKLSYMNIENVLNENGITELDFAVISSLDNSRSYSCDNIIKSMSPNSVIAPTEGERLDNLLAVCGNTDIEMYNVDGASSSFWEQERLEVFSDSKENRWLFFESGDYSVLICPENGNAEFLPDRAKEPSVMVINGEIPHRIEKLSPGMIVISDTLESGADIKNVLSSLGFVNIFTTGESGNIIIECRSDDYLTVRSEN